MSLLDTALRFIDYKPHSFVAPIPTNGIVDVFTLQNNVPLRYVVRNQKPGWYEINPGNKKLVGREAWVNEIEEYLRTLPRFYAIACIPSGDNCWIVVPYNASDASQRGWKNGEPRQVYLVNERIEPFDIIEIHNLAGTLLYKHLDYRLNKNMESEFLRGNIDKNIAAPDERDWRNAYLIIVDWYKKAERDAIRIKVQSQLAEVKDKMKFMLEFMGANLVSAEKKGKGYQVVWTAPDGHTYKMGVHEDGRIAVAGFCLAGTDSQHNLSSIVQVMEEAQRIERPDVNQAYADYEEDEDD